MNAKQYLPLVLALAAALVFYSCDEDNPPPPPTANMTILDAPDALLANVDTCYLYRVRLEATVADSVTVEVRDPDNQLHSTFALYDDGGTGSDFPDYTCAGSGDIIPNDVIYSRRINGSLLAEGVTGEYRFTFRAPNVTEQVRTMQVLNVEECVITADPLISFIPVCFSPSGMGAHVTRTDGDIVDSVRVYLYDMSDGSDLAEAILSPIADDTLWGTTLTPNFLRCTPSGSNYAWRYYAKTRFGMECTAILASVTVTNSLPVLSDLLMPDTIYRPIAPGDFDTSYVTVHMTDCELAGDTSFAGLFFDVSRDDTLHWPPSPAENFFLRDHGRDGDAVAGDQIYTVGLLTDTNYTYTNNVYYFRFYAMEGWIVGGGDPPWICSETFAQSDYVYDSVRVIQPGAVAQGHDGATHGEPGIRTAHRSAGDIPPVVPPRRRGTESRLN